MFSLSSFFVLHLPKSHNMKHVLHFVDKSARCIQQSWRRWPMDGRMFVSAIFYYCVGYIVVKCITHGKYVNIVHTLIIYATKLDFC